MPTDNNQHKARFNEHVIECDYHLEQLIKGMKKCGLGTAAQEHLLERLRLISRDFEVIYGNLKKNLPEDFSDLNPNPDPDTTGVLRKYPVLIHKEFGEGVWIV